MTTTTITFQERLKHVLGTQGYHNNMRRSVQTVILYEAHRCLAHKIDTLRPFQRKAAIMDQAQALLESLDFIAHDQKAKILWRTVASKDTLTGDIALRRVRNINKELDDLCDKIKPFIKPGRSHNESVDMLVEALFKSSKDNDCLVPAHWEHGHNHVITAFRLYYDGDHLDPTFPPPQSPREILIPATRPRNVTVADSTTSPPVNHSPVKGVSQGTTLEPVVISSLQHDGNLANDDDYVDVAAALGAIKPAEQRRRRLLQEVHEHLNLLKMFEGVIPDEDIVQRKKELFLALPHAPPASNKKSRMIV